MNKLITASINLKKVDQSLLIEGTKGRYLNLTIWVNDQVDKYGNDISIEQRVEKGKDKIYLGNGRTYKQNEQPVAPQPINENEDLDNIFK
jgi:hypothetical protein